MKPGVMAPAERVMVTKICNKSILTFASPHNESNGE